MKKQDRMECTLEEASKKARKEGGRFHFRDCWYIVDETGFIVLQVDQSIGLDMHVDFFSEKCVYEPPNQSVFQEWYGKIQESYHEDEYKQGWNAAIDAVLSLKRNPARDISDVNQIHPAIWCHEIGSLKEP
jgi:hypothetical protein